MRKKLFPSLMMVFAISGFSVAQQTIDWQNVREGENVEYCREHKLFEELMKDPAYRKAHEKDQATYQLEVEKSKNDIQSKAVVYRIPVVFHVLHNDGPENISREQIVDALNILNRDFRRLNADANTVHPDFQGMPSDIEIEFVMATKAPNGACFSGITRTKSPATSQGSNGGAQVSAIVNGNDVFNGDWPGNKYLNFFICADIGGAAGYTYRPNSGFPGSQMRNGIWVLHEYVGSIGTSDLNKSRTLTHECGHWLNLPHTWGSTNNPALQSNCGTDDGITDTPNTTGVTSCNLNDMGCGVRSNVENYLDYSYCSKMFTPGQKNVMRAAIASTVAGRNNVMSAANIAATGADSNFVLCKAEFNANKQVVCVGSVIDFNDQSFNSVSGWNWSFPGGTPATSTSPNPSVSYSTPGTYAVTLTATDGGTSQTTTKTDYIRVLPNGITLPYSESFEGYTALNAPSSFFSVNPSSNAANTWEVYTGAGASGNKSLRLRNYLNAIDMKDDFKSGNFNLSNLNSSDIVTLSFKYAYKKTSSAENEILRISASSSCGDVFNVRKTLSNTILGSGIETNEYVPAPGDWQQVHVVNITSSYFTSNMQVKFEFESDGGNNIFIDDINFYEGDQSNLGLEELTEVSNLTLYPNPSDEMVNIAFELVDEGQVSFEIKDLMGKTMFTHSIKGSRGSNLVMINAADFAQGAYVLQILSGNQKRSVQFMVN